MTYSTCWKHSCRRRASHIVRATTPDKRAYRYCLDHAAERLLKHGKVEVVLIPEDDK